MKILLIEDEPLVSKSFQIILDEAEHTVATAPDGRKALLLLESFDPDIIVLDLALPVMTGAEFVKELEQRYGDKHKVLVVTADPGEAPSSRLIKTIVRKPIDPAELLDLVKALGA